MSGSNRGWLSTLLNPPSPSDPANQSESGDSTNPPQAIVPAASQVTPGGSPAISQVATSQGVADPPPQDAHRQLPSLREAILNTPVDPPILRGNNLNHGNLHQYSSAYGSRQRMTYQLPPQAVGVLNQPRSTSNPSPATTHGGPSLHNRLPLRGANPSHGSTQHHDMAPPMTPVGGPRSGGLQGSTFPPSFAAGQPVPPANPPAAARPHSTNRLPGEPFDRPVHETWQSIGGSIQRCDSCERRARTGRIWKCLSPGCAIYVCEPCSVSLTFMHWRVPHRFRNETVRHLLGDDDSDEDTGRPPRDQRSQSPQRRPGNAQQGQAGRTYRQRDERGGNQQQPAPPTAAGNTGRTSTSRPQASNAAQEARRARYQQARGMGLQISATLGSPPPPEYRQPVRGIYPRLPGESSGGRQGTGNNQPPQQQQPDQGRRSPSRDPPIKTSDSQEDVKPLVGADARQVEAAQILSALRTDNVPPAPAARTAPVPVARVPPAAPVARLLPAPPRTPGTITAAMGHMRLPANNPRAPPPSAPAPAPAASRPGRGIPGGLPVPERPLLTMAQAQALEQRVTARMRVVEAQLDGLKKMEDLLASADDSGEE